MGIKLAPEIIRKTPAETIKRDAVFPEADFGTGETISSVATPSVSPAGLTLGGFTHDSNRTVEVACSGGSEDTLYTISFEATTSASQVLEGEVRVLVRA